MDRFKDNNEVKSADAQNNGELSTAESVDQTRRRFSTAALASSAVLLSLGNRSAWGGGGYVAGCMSVMTLNSFQPETGMFTSSPAGRPDHNVDLARRIHEVGGDSRDFLGRDGNWRTCEDPEQADGVCLVRGRCDGSSRVRN